ncbi:MAG: AraC family transcriptional regulator [Opitutus sp.]|nr:AraC family transcriptional regulator [Opitutus sp.]
MRKRPAPQEPLLNVDEISPTVQLAGCYHFKQPVGFEYRVPFHHFILLQRGQLNAVTARERFAAKAGDLICFRPADWNHYDVVADTLFFQMHVQLARPPRHWHMLYLDGIGPLPLCQPLGTCFDETWRCFENLCIAITRSGTAAHLRTQAAVWEILALLAQAAAAERKNWVEQPDRWRRAKQRLESTLNRPVPIRALAAELGVSTTYFIREFARQFGVTPKVCHTLARLREGIRWLRHGDRTVKSIALSLGFPDPKTFTRRLRHHFGLTPTKLAHARLPIETMLAENKLDGLFSLNQRLLPPEEGTVDPAKFMPRGGALSPREYRRTLEKIQYPAHFA